MNISAKIICDSLAPNRKRLTTFELRYPRFIHSELMTHRLFARNASSSRAIPTRKILAEIIKDPAGPVFWGRNQAGMQARTQLFGISGWLAKRVWFGARWFAVLAAWILNKLGLHKQIANRIVEPWAHITTLVTATEFEGWFRLRCHEDAQPEIRNLALKMQKLYDNRDATLVDTFEYHLPFINLIDRLTHSNDTNILRKISVARCARVSYLNHNNKVANAEEDIKLHDQLLASGHMSPFEHQALAMTNKNWSGPFQGWFQYRETVDKNFVKVGE